MSAPPQTRPLSYLIVSFIVSLIVSSGKSSLILALFRLVEPCGGSIVIDGLDVSSLGLAALRKAITIIPQVRCSPLMTCLACKCSPQRAAPSFHRTRRCTRARSRIIWTPSGATRPRRSRRRFRCHPIGQRSAFRGPPDCLLDCLLLCLPDRERSGLRCRRSGFHRAGCMRRWRPRAPISHLESARCLLLIATDYLALPLLTSLTKPSTHFVMSSGGGPHSCSASRARCSRGARSSCLTKRRPIWMRTRTRASNACSGAR